MLENSLVFTKIISVEKLQNNLIDTSILMFKLKFLALTFCLIKRLFSFVFICGLSLMS